MLILYFLDAKTSSCKMSQLLVLYLHRDSNSDLIFRRDLFYPLNYRGIVGRQCLVCYSCTLVVTAENPTRDVCSECKSNTFF